MTGAGGELVDAVLGMDVAQTAAALLAVTSWLVHAARGTTLPRQACFALAGWAGVSGLALLVGSVPGRDTAPLIWLFGIVGTGLALLGAGLCAPIVVLDGAVAGLAAEAALISTCLVAIVWGLVGPPTAAPETVLPLAMTMVAIGVAGMILRGLVAAPSALVDTRYRHLLVAAAASTLAFAAAHAARTMAAVGLHVPWVAPGVAAIVGLLCSAAVPWVGLARPQRARASSFADRTAPYVLVAAAVTAQAVGAARSSLGALNLGLVALVIGSLLVVQALALRENSRLSSALEYSRARLAALVENAGDVILGLDGRGRVVTANAAALVLLHRSPDLLVGADVAEVAVLEERQRVRDAVAEVVRGRAASARAELTLAPPATGTVELRLRGVPGGAVANLSDVTESVRLRERLARMARYDQMTGLANRMHLEEKLRLWLDGGHTVSVLYLDLDGFKAVNDRFGHLTGDAVLVEAARRLTGGVGAIEASRTVVARIGGDEFVVALLDTALPAAMAGADRLVVALRPSFPVADRMLRIGVSIGVAATDDGARTGPGAQGAADLLHRADIAMFAAKQSGQSQVARWEAALEERALRKVDIAIGLRRALDTGRLALAYQPIVRLADGVIVGAEALIRLDTTDEATPHTAPDESPGALAGLAELVSPAELVEVAEGTGEIDELGRWVLVEATHQAYLWQQLGRDVRVNVNMSVRQLSDPGFVEAVRGALTRARLAPDRLVIEITEGQMLGEGDLANSTIRRLRADGVQLAIDDFGSGYSSLSYLRRMPVRTVKVDRTLLDGVGSDPRATTLIRAVIGAARGLGLLVVCEGIENLAMARLLRDLGAWAGQGFALHAAMSPSALLDVLEAPPISLADPPGRPPRRRRTTLTQPVGISHHETAASRD
jgi:diguanylate cyclase (GGDEF)-like protein